MRVLELDALVALTSQFVEGGANSNDALVPKTPEQRRQREAHRRNDFRNANAGVASKYRDKLVQQYGEKGKAVKYAEAFEVCEYGRRPPPEELSKRFPAPVHVASEQVAARPGKVSRSISDRARPCATAG